MPSKAFSYLVFALIVASEAAFSCQDVSAALDQYATAHQKWLESNNLVKNETIIGIVAPNERIKFPDLTSSECDKGSLADLVEAAVNGKFLAFSDMKETSLQEVNFANVLSMRGAWLTEADLQSAKFPSVDLETADLTDASLRLADLTGANLRRARLIRTNLDEATVSGIILAFANVKDATYSPKPTHLPSKEVIGMKSVHTVKFGAMRESGMAQLRTIYKELHLRDLEQDATFAIRRATATFFEYVAFDLSVAWGRKPGRALKIMLIAFGAATLFYALVIGTQSSNKTKLEWKTYILRARLSEHVSYDHGSFTIGGRLLYRGSQNIWIRSIGLVHLVLLSFRVSHRVA